MAKLMINDGVIYNQEYKQKRYNIKLNSPIRIYFG